MAGEQSATIAAACAILPFSIFLSVNHNRHQAKNPNRDAFFTFAMRNF
jgi:hypothetical protein